MKYLQQIDSFQLRCSLTRFRFGQHWLQCHRGRFQGLPYEARVCNACVQHVDSEHHAMCGCPKYEGSHISCKSAKSGTFSTQLRTCR